MSTIARTKTPEASHYYFTDGRPCYEVENKTKGGFRPATLADCKKLNLLPSVSTILSVLNKPALNEWKVEQAVLAIASATRLEGEGLDAFIHRILHVERDQDQESKIARDKGTELHDALQCALEGRVAEVNPETFEWIRPAFDFLMSVCKPLHCERCLVGQGYAGKTDLIAVEPDGTNILFDFKSTKKLPDKGAWSEHVLQLGAYAYAWQRETGASHISTANLYISTVEKGKFVVWRHPEGKWLDAATGGFRPLLDYWQWANNFVPVQ